MVISHLDSKLVDQACNLVAAGAEPQEICDQLGLSLAEANFIYLQIRTRTTETKLPRLADLKKELEEAQGKASPWQEENAKTLTKYLLLSGFLPRQAKYFSNLSIHQCNRMLLNLKQDTDVMHPLFPFPMTTASRFVATVFLTYYVTVAKLKNKKSVDLDCFIHAWMLTFDQFRDIKTEFLTDYCPELLLPGTLLELAHGLYESGDHNTPQEELATTKSRKFLLTQCPTCGMSYPYFLSRKAESDTQSCPYCDVVEHPQIFVTKDEDETACSDSEDGPTTCDSKSVKAKTGKKTQAPETAAKV